MTKPDKSAAMLRGILLFAGITLAIRAASADEHSYNVANDKFKSECGSCHVAYPPALLPASSWREMMATLDKHFGSDASVDAKTAQEIGDFLTRNAAPRRKIAAGSGTLRITETGWFRDEHDEKLSPAVWKNPKVNSPANCGACHMRAALGDYGERSLRVPR